MNDTAPRGSVDFARVGLARGMAVHESQSLLIEMQVCRSRAFFEFLFRKTKKELRGCGGRLRQRGDVDVW